MNSNFLRAERGWVPVRAALTLSLLFAFGLFLMKLDVAGDGGQSRLDRISGSSTVQNAPAYGHLPLGFEANVGQTDPQVKFVARGAGYGIYLTATEAVLTLQSSSATGIDRPGTSKKSIIAMSLEDTNRDAVVSGMDVLPGKSNYFVGNDPSSWYRNIQQFARVRYQDIYPGIDLVYYGSHGNLEYDFVVHPGTDAQANCGETPWPKSSRSFDFGRHNFCR